MARHSSVVWTVAAGKQFFVRLVIYTTALLTIETSSASANVLISVNKNTQQMSVSVDGVPRYEFAVSTGRAGYGTPNGTYRPQWMAKSWFSKEYYNSPMPHSIFFHRGYAIHGSYEINRLGGPASHGCIRLHPENAATLFALVQREGMPATNIVVYGNNPAFVQRRAPTDQSSYENEPITPMQPGPQFFLPFQTPSNTFDPGRIY
jgi:lipoprotein-anchoring transpeptidase ErfK/SrfK